MSATDMTREHYCRPEIKEIILNLSCEGAFSRWGNGDGVGWYRYDTEKKQALKLSDEYDRITDTYRTLYWSLNLFDSRVFGLDYNKLTHEESPIKSREYTRAYTFGVDIDTVDPVNGHGANIQDPAVKEAVEAMARYYVARLKEHAPNSVHVLFSGGGIYVLLHHKATEPYFKRYENSNDWTDKMEVLIRTMNAYFDSISKDFANEYPEHAKHAKADILNNAKRIFKSLFSIHKKHPFACIPLDPDNIVIDFDKARVPLSTETVESGRNWYQTYDNGVEFLESLQAYEAQATEEVENRYKHDGFDVGADISDKPIDAENWPPCIRNILNMPTCGEGRTRALALIASFLGQAGISEDQAKDVFYKLARRWGATTANIFDSYYQKMHVPTCSNLRADNNIGFPAGVSIRKLGVCKPDIRCMNVVSPRYYADKQANINRLKKRLNREEGPQ